MATLRILVILLIVLSLNKTFKVQLKQGQYLIEDSADKINNM